MTYSISIASQLMMNHVAGEAVSAPSRMATVMDAQSSPLLFFLDGTNVFKVAVRDAASLSGWTLVDLGAQLPQVSGQTQQVDTFAVSQGPDGSIWVAIAARATGTGASNIYVSQAFADHATIANWQAFGAQLIPRPLPQPVTAAQLMLGVGDGVAPTPLLVVQGQDSGGNVCFYQVNPDPGDPNWVAMPLPLPFNVTTCLAAQPGCINNLGGIGVYTLCQLAGVPILTFTAVPTYVGGQPFPGATITLGLPPGAALTCLAAMVRPDLQTELYAGGNGVYRFDMTAQVNAKQPPEQIEDGTYFTAVTALDVQQDDVSGVTGVWGLVQSDVMMFLRGEPAPGGAMTWQVPLPLDKGVTAFAAQAATAQPGEPVAFSAATGYAGGELSLKTQDVLTGLWRSEPVAAMVADSAVAIETYTMTISVFDDTRRPAAFTDVTIAANFDCPVRINGQYRNLLAGSALTATTTASGTITVIAQTEALEAPVLTVAIGKVSQAHNPMDRLRSELGKYKTGSDLMSATNSAGNLVFPNADQASADLAAKSLVSLTIAYDGLPGDGTRANYAGYSPGAPRRMMLAMSRDVDGVMREVTDSAVIAHMLGQAGATGITALAGDIFSAIASGVEQIGKVLVSLAGTAWEFLVDIGGRLMKFVLDAGAQVLNAVNWVLKETLGADLNDIVAWLGFVFDWDAILQTKQVIAHLIDLSIDYAVASIDDAKTTVSAQAKKLRLMIKTGFQIDTSNPAFAAAGGTGPDGSAAVEPQADWGTHHMETGMSSATVSTSALSAASFLQAMDTVATTQCAGFAAALTALIKDITDNYDSLSLSAIIQKVVAAVATALVDLMEAAGLAILDAAKLAAQVVRTLISARIDIPVITYVYEQVICKGSTLSFLDLTSLLVAIPASIGYRALCNKPLLSDVVAQAVLKTTTFDQAVAVFANPPVKNSGGAHALVGAPSQIESYLLALQLLSVCSRTMSTVASGLKDLTPPNSPIKFAAAGSKLVADYATATFGTMQYAVAKALTPVTPTTDTRKAIVNGFLISFPWIYILKDTFLQAYWSEKAVEASDSIKTPLAFAEGVGGCLQLILVGYSSYVDFDAGPPPQLTTAGDKAAWGVATGAKTLQNVINCVVRITSPGQYIVPPRKYDIAVARVAMRSVSVLCGAVRYGIESRVDFTDLDL